MSITTNKMNKIKEWFGLKGKIKYLPLWKWLLQEKIN